MSGPKEPFGYYLNAGTLHAKEEELRALEQAKFYIYQGCSMQSVRDWLVNKTGRTISTPGLLKAIKYDKTMRGTDLKDTSGQTT